MITVAELKAKDLVAFMLIIALVVFKLTGHNGTLDIAVALIVGYYFGRRSDDEGKVNPDNIE